MTKRQLIDDIRRYNVTAQPQFLAQFDDDALKQYLEHLEHALTKHLARRRTSPGAEASHGQLKCQPRGRAGNSKAGKLKSTKAENGRAGCASIFCFCAFKLPLPAFASCFPV